MAVAHNMRKSVINKLVFEGWEIADDYHVAGVTVMVRALPDIVQTVTVMKNGKMKAGNHPPAN